MENITEIIEPMTEEVIVIIDHGNGTFTSMLKSTYDEQQAQAEHFTPSLPE
jgi:hypothetical protein